MCINQLGQEIERTRVELNSLYERKFSLTDPEVVRLSQQLDVLIVRFQKENHPHNLNK